MYANIYKKVIGDEPKFNTRTIPSDDNAFETYKEAWNKYQDKRDPQF